MRPAYDPREEDHSPPLNHGEAKQKLFIYIFVTIIEDGEMRSLKKLSEEYACICLNFGIMTIVKSSHVRDLLEQEFGNKIGFHGREHQNKSAIVYNPNLTGSYIEAGINFRNVETPAVLKEAASRMREFLVSKPGFEFPPTLASLTKHFTACGRRY